MIITRVPDGLRVITQTAHQAQCRRIMSAWGNSGFARPLPWEPVVAAAGVHDEGWREWEKHPRVDGEGNPQGFTEIPPAGHCGIHARSAAAARRVGPRVGLLVGMHVTGLTMGRLGLDGPMPALGGRDDAIRALVRDEAGHARAARAECGEGPNLASWAWAAYRLLQAVDVLGLYLTWTGLIPGSTWTLPRVPRCEGDEAGADLRVCPAGETACAVAPWPFGPDAVPAPVECRIIDDRPYVDDADLGAALDAARVVQMPMEVVAA